MIIAKRSFWGLSRFPPSCEAEYRVAYTSPTIFSKVFNSGTCCTTKTIFRYTKGNSNVGIVEDRFLIIDGDVHNCAMTLLFFSCYGIDYYFDCPEIGSPLSKASEKGLAFQEFLLDKKREDTELISSLQQRFSMSRHSENKIWQDLLTQFEYKYTNNGR